MMKGAIVGFGEVASNGHWPAYQASTEATIVAVVDRVPARRALAEHLIPGVATFESIADVPDGLQFADVCTPPALHQEPVLAALDRGWHVLCEKPLVLQSGFVAPIRARAIARGLAVVPAHNWKYAPILTRTTALQRAGVIGQVRHAEIVTSRTQAAVTAAGGGYNWRQDPAMAGGGILMDHGWHSIYLALHWFQETPIGIDVDMHRPGAGGVEDEVSLTVRFPSGDAHIALTWRGASRRNTVTLVGDAGEIVADDDTLYVRGAQPRTEQMTAALSAGSSHADWFTAMLPDVVEAFRHPEQSRPLFEEAATCLSIIEQAYASVPAV
jgi:predicted dehydrogenase